MNERFSDELDRYERALAPRIGETPAADARREMAAHLAADYEARRDFGDSEAEAYAGAIAAFGNVRRMAWSEPIRGRATGEVVLLVAPVFLALEFFLPQTFPLHTHSVFVGAATLAVLVAAVSARPARRPWLWGLLGGGLLGLVTSLLLAMGRNWIETGSFSLGRLSQGTWWEAWIMVPMFGLPPLVLYRVASALARRTRAAFDARWVRRV